jgi:hypothetical protein
MDGLGKGCIVNGVDTRFLACELWSSMKLINELVIHLCPSVPLFSNFLVS